MSDTKENLNQYFLAQEAANELTGFQQNNQIPGMASMENGETSDMGYQNGSGTNFQSLDVSTPCVFMPAVIVVMSVPLMYVKEDGAATPMAYLLKDLMENHARQVTGIDFGYTVETQEAGIGNDSQVFMVPGKTKRSQPSPSFTFPELQSNIVWTTFRRWMFDMNHPDTNASLGSGGMYPGAWTMSAYSMSFLAIQYDQTMLPSHIVDAAYYTNVFPTSIGDIGIERVLGSTKHPERTINFSAIVQHNDATKALGAAVAAQLQLHKHNYNIAPTQRDGIQDAISESGYWAEHKKRVEDWSSNAEEKYDLEASNPWDGEKATLGTLNTNGDENGIGYSTGSSAPQEPQADNTTWNEL